MEAIKLNTIFTIIRENTTRLIFHTAFALTITSGLSYISGLIRSRLLAQKFGATDELDAYFAAFVIPDLITGIAVTSIVAVAMIPIFTKQWKESLEKAAIYTYSLLFFILLCVATCAIAAILCAPFFAEVLVPTYEGEQKERYIRIMQILLFSPLLFAVSNIFGGVLLSTRDFFFYGIAPVFYNIGIIAGLYFFEPLWGIYGIAFGTILGAFLHMMSRFVIGVGRVGFSEYIPRIRIFKNPLIWESLKLSWPKMIHIAAVQIMLLWFTSLAISMHEGANTIYNYARDFQSMPVSLIGIAIGLATFTSLSIAAAHANYTSFREILIRKVILVLTLTTLAALSLNAIAPALLKIFLGGGKFTESAIEQTIYLLQIYVWSIPFESLAHVLARANYALKKTLIPSLINVFMVIIVITLSKQMVDPFGIKAIPYAFFTGLIIQNLLFYLALRYYLSKKSVASKE